MTSEVRSTHVATIPSLIQGGMGAGVSGWRLAREVSIRGGLGVVSGTALDTILVRRLCIADECKHIRRALEAFPVPTVAQWVLRKYAQQDDGTGNGGVGGCAAGSNGALQTRFPVIPLPSFPLSRWSEWLLVLANFVEVYLAKEGHAGKVGINYLHKIQMPLLPSIYGAMLAGVDVVLMGAGIPAEIPDALSALCAHSPAHVPLEVSGMNTPRLEVRFDPSTIWCDGALSPLPKIKKPLFLAIVSSAVLMKALLKRAPGGIDGFVIEYPIAGGHNAPPRGRPELNARGEPVYGPRDQIDLCEVRSLGVPFWLAGGYGSREKYLTAIGLGAAGVQVGTVFAFCEESGLFASLKHRFLVGVARGTMRTLTDPLASPTGFPFKVAEMAGTLSEPTLYESRPRRCDLGYLRRAYLRADGTVGFRCPGECVDEFIRKGGSLADTVGRKCLCNALMANIGFAQQQPDGYEELPLLTSGDDLECLRPFILDSNNPTYRAASVVNTVL